MCECVSAFVRVYVMIKRIRTRTHKRTNKRKCYKIFHLNVLERERKMGSKYLFNFTKKKRKLLLYYSFSYFVYGTCLKPRKNYKLNPRGRNEILYWIKKIFDSRLNYYIFYFLFFYKKRKKTRWRQKFILFYFCY